MPPDRAHPTGDHGGLSRRRLLATGAAAAVPLGVFGAAASGATAARAGLGRQQTPAAAGPSVRGADTSFTLQLERAGATWRWGSWQASPTRILRSAGANWIRLRVWVNPPDGYSTADSALELARRAKNEGMNVLLDLHYSDFWADPGKQDIPEAWTGQNLGQLGETVYLYTRDIVERFSRSGAPVDMVQVGNEVTAGMLWPLGQIYRDGQENFDDFTVLLDAGLWGVWDASVSPTPRTMVHLDRGGDNGGTRYFFDRVLARGIDFGVIGQSYYPFWHGPLADLEYNLVDTAERYGKDIIVVETSYPWTLENGDWHGNLIAEASQLPDRENWPPTPQGQFAYFQALRDVFGRVPGGRALGFMSWEPEWIPGVGWAPGEGNPNDNLTLFDFNGEALPAIEAFSPGRM